MSFERFQAGPSEWAEPELLPLEQRPDAAPASEHMITVLAAIERMEQGVRPACISEKRWFVLLRDLRRFTTQWLDLAVGCGWPMHDIYGTAPELVQGRLDVNGIVVLLGGREILSLDPNRAIIGNRVGSPNVFYRHAPGVSVPFDRSRGRLVWEAVSAFHEGLVQW